MKSFVIYLREDDRLCKVFHANTEREAKTMAAAEWNVRVIDVEAEIERKRE